jgi:predicted phosphodiesterase
MSTRLGTFVHISDLHFGDIDPNTGQVVQHLDVQASKIWATCSWFDGLLGHSYRALERLEKFFSQIRRDEDAQLIVTGDVTCVGKQEQFETADEYLRDKLLPPKGSHLGLSATDWKDRAVPGNHDHWPGAATIWGKRTPAFRTHFPTLPFVGPPLVGPLLQHTANPQLQFIGINTDADIDPYGWKRGLARGSFCSQLATAAGLLGLPDERTIRVLILHHSHAYRARPYRGRALEMDDASRQALEVFLVEQDIAVLLCGHTHAPLVKPFSATHQGKTIKVLEARCGTTLQTDTIPYHWKTILGNRPRRQLTANTLLVHRLLEENGEVIWHAETYTRTPFGFGKRGPEDRLKVWPHP